MSNQRESAQTVLSEFLVRASKATEFTGETRLFADGLGLDSLETAELSATLEDEIGHDPFSAGQVPQTVEELLAFYDGELATES